MISYIELSWLLSMLALSSLFSMSETALTIASKPAMSAMGIGGKLNLWLISQKKRVIPAILVCNNIAGLCSASIFTAIFLRSVGEIGVIYATICSTLLIVIFGEIIPKTIALHAPITCVNRLRILIYISYVAISPFIYIIGYLTQYITQSIQKASATTSDQYMIRELKYDLERKFQNKTDTLKMLIGVLEMTTTSIEAIMVHKNNVYIVNDKLSDDEFCDQIFKSRYSRVPVMKGNKDIVLGIINVKLFLKLQSKVGVQKARIESMSKPWMVIAQTPLSLQLEMFKNKRRHMSIVIDEYGNYLGIVTLEDLLETIAGDIFDEDDIGSKQIEKVCHNVYHVNGSAKILAINKSIGTNITIKGREYSTISGFVISKMRKIPEPGEKIKLSKCTISVIERKREFITKVAITLKDKDKKYNKNDTKKSNTRKN